GNRSEDFGPGIFSFDFIPDAGSSCESATEVSNDGTYAFDTTSADTTAPCFELGRTVWYRYTATEAGTLDLDLCGSSFTTYLTVYKGPVCPEACNNVEVYYDNDSCGDLNGALSLTVNPGEVFHIAINGDGPDDFGIG